jgi:hypothetical protein
VTNLACAAPRCALLRRHKDTCQQDECRGCLPALAQDGLRLCPLHTTRIATDAVRIAELDTEIEQVLGLAGRGGERTSTTTLHGIIPNEKAMETRTELRHTLASWCKLIGEERGHHLPPNTLLAMGAYIAANAEWLSASDYAGDCSDELNSLQRRAWNTAYPSGARVFDIGPCPASGCSSTIRVVLRAADSVVPSELVCDNTPPHRWPYSQTAWRKLGAQINQRYLSASEIAEYWELSLSRVYAYAAEAHWARAQDGRRPALYLASDVRATLDREEATA